MLDNEYERNECFENSEDSVPVQDGKNTFSSSWESMLAVPAASSEGMTGGEITHRKFRLKGMKIAVCCTLAGIFLGAGILYGVGQIPGTAAQVNLSNRTVQQVSVKAVDSSTKMSTAEIYAADVNSVVSINCSGAATNYFGQSVPYASSGSGFIITNDGYIMTNAHVIDGANNIKVTLYSGSTYDATVVGSDTDYDIAVLKIEANGLSPVTLGDSSKINVGDSALVIGNPLGELTFSMSSGIISCANRTINVSGAPYHMIQVDTSINAGNSGGPLLNEYGEVIGVVSAKYSSYATTPVEGLGFAIPINDAFSVAKDLMTNGSMANKAYIGITAATVTQALAQQSGLHQGVYVYSVDPGSAAEAAGLQNGDVIIKMDGTNITSMQELSDIKKTHSAGDTVSIEIIRNNQTFQLSLTFEAQPSSSSHSNLN
ncbi:MAG: PDZ domain-containing protein [Clostridium sp.]|jgi:serine protease Do